MTIPGRSGLVRHRIELPIRQNSGPPSGCGRKKQMKLKARLNKREQRAAALLAHYATCERLAAALGVPAAKIDGKRISVALLTIERDASNAATAQCNGAAYLNQPYREDCDANGDETSAQTPWSAFCATIEQRVAAVFNGTLPPGFRFNKNPRGYALKTDDAALIVAARLATDWGGYGLLSPEISD